MLSPTIEWLYGLRSLGVKLGLEQIRALLDLLGHPERRYPSAIVGGTNGKGSVAAMLEAIAGAHGKRTGLLTSPHLVRPNERIRVDGRDLDDVALDAALERTRRCIEEAIAAGKLELHPSFFEVLTGTALEEFARREVDVALLEVGMGGRLDATNAVEAALSIIVSIGFDHMKSLGGSIDSIATEKAGIVKAGRPLISGVHAGAARDVVTRVCVEREASFVDATAATLTAGPDGSFEIDTGRGQYRDLRLSLAGRHQQENARVALLAFEHLAERLGLTPEVPAVREGLANVRWPGRLQRIDGGAGQPSMLLDGAHNAAGAKALAVFLEEQAPVRRVLLFSALRGKEIDKIFATLAPWLDGIVITDPGVERALPLEEVARAAGRCIGSVTVEPDPATALAAARKQAGVGGEVLVAGSLYLVGRVMGMLEGKDVPGPVPL